MLEIKETTLTAPTPEGESKGWRGLALGFCLALDQSQEGVRDKDTCGTVQTVLGIPSLTPQAVKRGDNSVGVQGPSSQMPPSPSYLKQSWLSLRNVTITVENQNKKAM